MDQGVQSIVKELVVSGDGFAATEINQLIQTIAEDFGSYRDLREAVQELQTKNDSSGAGKTRLGVCQFLLGRYAAAIETLTGTRGPEAHYYLARAHSDSGQYDEATKAFTAAAKAGHDSGYCALGKAEALRRSGNAKAALAALDDLSGAIEQTAEYLYQRASTVAQLGGNPTEVVALLERAVEADPKHAGALFGLAVENDRRGNDKAALDLYERSTSRFPAHVGSLLNLGILYEDRNEYDKARRCYQRILDAEPSHPRARLFLKDSQASGDMFYDEDAQRRRDRLQQILGVPVTDFELSVRSRNCLQKMGIMTLGDLANTSEQELLASKNFGETSLVEIKEMMTSKGLELGQFAPERQRPEYEYEPQTMTPDEQVMLGRPIADLNLSVRARKCMTRLGVTSVGDLLRRTGDELLECKNFGVTSLNEVREKLTQHGLKLRGE